jgi:hypothetical protein
VGAVILRWLLSTGLWFYMGGGQGVQQQQQQNISESRSHTLR